MYNYKKEITSSIISAKNTDQFSKKNGKLDNYSNESLDTNIGCIRNDYLQFLKQDISCIMQQRIQNGYGLKVQSLVNPLSGAIDGIYDIADVIVNHNTSEINFRLKAVVSRPEEVKWNHMYDTLPFPKYTHPFR